MALNLTTKQLSELLSHITDDLTKAENGNKAAAQRVRTGTVKLEKVAKLYRKESIKGEKANKGQKKPVKKTASSSTKGSTANSKSGASKSSSSAKNSSSKNDSSRNDSSKNGSSKSGHSKNHASSHSSKDNSSRDHSSKDQGSKASHAKPKAKTHKALAKPRALSLRKPTAKLPNRSSK